MTDRRTLTLKQQPACAECGDVRAPMIPCSRQKCPAALRAVPYVETDLETAYGSTVRLSRSVRVF